MFTPRPDAGGAAQNRPNPFVATSPKLPLILTSATSSGVFLEQGEAGVGSGGVKPVFTPRPDAGGATQNRPNPSVPQPPTIAPQESVYPTPSNDHGSYMSRPGGHIVSFARPHAGGGPTNRAVRPPFTTRSENTDMGPHN